MMMLECLEPANVAALQELPELEPAPLDLVCTYTCDGSTCTVTMETY